MDESEPEALLVGVDVSDPPDFPESLLQQLSSFDILLLGWKEIPEETSTEQARQQFEDETRDALASVAASFEENGAQVDTRLAFPSDRFTAIERAVAKEDFDAVLIPHPLAEITRLLLSLRGLVNADRMTRMAGHLTEAETDVTLLHVAEGSEEPKDAEKTLLAEVARQLVDEGIDERRIQRISETGQSPAEAVNETAQRGDLVMIGESKPSSGSGLFSRRSERIAREAPAPVLIVKHAHDERRTDPAAHAADRQT